IFAKQAQFVATMMGNLDWYEGLSDDQREMIKEVTADLVETGHEIQSEFNEKLLDKIKADSDIKIVELTDEQREKFRELVKPVRQTFIDEVGENAKKSLDILLEAYGDAES